MRYTSAVGTGQGVFGNASVEIQYKATVTPSGTVELDEVPYSFKQLPTSNTPTFIESNAALLSAIELAKQNALAAAGFKSAAETNVMDGKIEADISNTQRKITLDWLNAYNAPHWMQFFANTSTSADAAPRYEEFNNKLAVGNTIWKNLQTGTDNKNNVFGTSWTFDLMRAGGLAKPAANTEPLLFNGAVNLGMIINLGINKAYISENNQKKIDGNEILFGLLKDDNSITQALKANTQQWDFNNVMTLSDLLHNPNIKNTSGNDLSNSNNSGAQNQINDQTKALRDFLSLYTATQNDTVAGNGSRNEIAVLGGGNDAAKNETIRKALFGDGTQATGLINKDNLLMGGKGLLISELTAEMLGSIMGNISGADYITWAKALKPAMIKFNINTPKEIAAFFAQVSNETGGLSKWIEPGNNWTAANLANPSLFGNRFTGLSGHKDPSGNDLTWAQYLGRPVDVNGKLIPGSPLLSEEVAKQIANMAYNGKNGNIVGSDDGWNFRGRGPFHLTGRVNYEAFAKYIAGEGTPLYNNIVNNPDSMNTDFDLLALSAGWYWANHLNKPTVNLYASTDNLPSISVTQTQFDVISGVIASDRGSFDERFGSYTDNLHILTNNGNPYENIQKVLANLGIKAASKAGYEQQFGISLRPPALLPVAGNIEHLLVTDSVFNTDTELKTQLVNANSLQTIMQTLLQQAQVELNLNEGEFTMFTLDAPNTPPQQTNVVMIAQNNQNQLAAKKTERVVGVCEVVDNSERRSPSGELYQNSEQISPKNSVNIYLQKYEQRNDFLDGDWNLIKTTVLSQPKHGTLTDVIVNGTNHGYRYEPNSGYLGEDSIVVQVEGNGVKVKVIYYLHVLQDPGYNPLDEECGKTGTLWKISTAPNADLTIIGLDSTTANLADGTYSLGLPAAFVGADYASPTVTFANLTGAAIGETKGEGANATITLDTDAAGHGWYIDYTPYLNDDFLPTSNPNEWVAKAGSEAAGKMDLLSVLLHEYGHALGLEHSADAHDFMGTTLTPGTRRLPSADELTLMAQLVAEAKQNLAGLDGTAISGNGTNPTPSPIPTLPLGAGFGISFLGLTRRNNNSAGSLFGEAHPPTPRRNTTSPPIRPWLTASWTAPTAGQPPATSPSIFDRLRTGGRRGGIQRNGRQPNPPEPSLRPRRARPLPVVHPR